MIRKKIFHIFLGTIQAGLVMLLWGALFYDQTFARRRSALYRIENYY